MCNSTVIEVCPEFRGQARCLLRHTHLTHVLYTFLTIFIHLHSIIVNWHIQSLHLFILRANILEAVYYFSGKSFLQTIFTGNWENLQFYN